MRPYLARLSPVLGGILAAYLLYALGSFVRLSLRWPLVGDATLMHYCVFLLQHGWAPYRQIVDINLPGTYLAEWLIVRLFGYGALPWRCFDLLLLLTLGCTSLAILRHLRAAAGQVPGWVEWLAALWLTTLFALLHGRNGIAQLGQRDLLITALLALAYAVLPTPAMQRASVGKTTLLAPFGFGLCIGAAATVKPLALLLLPVSLLLWRAHNKQRYKNFLLGWAVCAGASLPLFAAVAYLIYEHALAAFWQITTHLIPLHGSLFRFPTERLLAGSVSSVLLPLFLLALPVALAQKPWRTFGGASLVVGFFFGVLSFCVQGRGYPYHRYPSELFLLLLCAHMLPTALGSPRTHLAVRGFALASILFSVGVVAPRSLHAVRQFTPQTDSFDAALSAALLAQGGPRAKNQLAGQVQCLDMAGGCLTVLLRLQLAQSTGFLYDCYAFVPSSTPALRHEQQSYQAAWMQAITAHPPRLFIATSDECGPPDNLYTKLNHWPALANLLATHYRLAEQWNPTQLQSWGGKPSLPYGFRIYARK